MKSLNDWLASSDDENSARRSGSSRRNSSSAAKDIASPAAAIPASMESPTWAKGRAKPAQIPAKLSAQPAQDKRQQEAEERRRKQEEMRSKMKDIVGTAVVEKIENQMRKVLNESDDSNSTFSSTNNMPMPATLPPFVPSSARSSQQDLAGRGKAPHLDSSALGLGTANSGVFNPHRNSWGESLPQAAAAVETYEVMLSDRGTQTVTNADTQTDPDFNVASCPGCYYDHYGHAPPARLPCAHGTPGFPGAETPSPDPVFAAMLAGFNSQQRAPVMGGNHAAQHRYSAVNPQQALPPSASATLRKAQLQTIQQTIDMCISKYNLPPPPTR